MLSQVRSSDCVRFLQQLNTPILRKYGVLFMYSAADRSKCCFTVSYTMHVGGETPYEGTRLTSVFDSDVREEPFCVCMNFSDLLPVLKIRDGFVRFSDNRTADTPDRLNLSIAHVDGDPGIHHTVNVVDAVYSQTFPAVNLRAAADSLTLDGLRLVWHAPVTGVFLETELHRGDVLEINRMLAAVGVSEMERKRIMSKAAMPPPLPDSPEGAAPAEPDKGYHLCQACEGKKVNTKGQPCPICKGTGQVQDQEQPPNPTPPVAETPPEAKQEPAKQEPAKQEPAKQEPAKQEPAENSGSKTGNAAHSLNEWQKRTKTGEHGYRRSAEERESDEVQAAKLFLEERNFQVSDGQDKPQASKEAISARLLSTATTLEQCAALVRDLHTGPDVAALRTKLEELQAAISA